MVALLFVLNRGQDHCSILMLGYCNEIFHHFFNYNFQILQNLGTADMK